VDVNYLINEVTDFLKSITNEIVVSLIGAAIIAFLTWIISLIRKSSAYQSLFKSGIIRIYPNQEKAKKDILKHLEKAKSIRVFCIRGYSFVQPDREFYSVLKNSEAYEDSRIQFCLADPEGEAVRSRGREIPGKSESVYVSEVKQTINTLFWKTKSSKNIEVRLHLEDPVFRIYIVDEIIYLGFFQKGKVAKDSRIMKIGPKSPLYNALIKYYESIWEKSSKVEGEY